LALDLAIPKLRIPEPCRSRAFHDTHETVRAFYRRDVPLPFEHHDLSVIGNRLWGRASCKDRILSFKIRRMEVRPMSRWRTMADLLRPAQPSLRTSSACNAAVAWPGQRAPVRAKSRSNSANTAGSSAMARPVGAVSSSASVSETKPTPRCSSSCGAHVTLELFHHGNLH